MKRLAVLTISTATFILALSGLATESDTQTEAPDKKDAPAATAPGDDTTMPDEDVVQPEPDNLREAVTRSLQTFVPSEEIDVDKPVDFPTNI